MFRVNALNEDNQSKGDVKIDKLPDECPICHKSITPGYYNSFLNGKNLQVIFRCPSEDCKNIFIGFYVDRYSSGSFSFEFSKPQELWSRKFTGIVKDISADFVKIHNQAEKAEQIGLNEICGAGYRKALEFLIKDYLIGKNKNDEEKIKKEFLGNTIKNRITDSRIKERSSKKGGLAW